MFWDAVLGARRRRAGRHRSMEPHHEGMLAEQVRAGEAHKKWLADAMALARAAQVANRER